MFLKRLTGYRKEIIIVNAVLGVRVSQNHFRIILAMKQRWSVLLILSE